MQWLFIVQIQLSEITYATNKSLLIAKIADLVKEGKILGIKDLRDESDKEGVRIIVELKKDAYPQKVLNKLYDTTDLQKNFNVNMLALVDGIDDTEHSGGNVTQGEQGGQWVHKNTSVHIGSTAV